MPFVAPCVIPHVFIARYFRDRLIFHRERGVVYVFDEKTRVWLSGTSGTVCLGNMVDDLNKLYCRYMHARQLTNTVMTDDESRKFISKNNVFLLISALQRSKLLNELQLYPMDMMLGEMNPNTELLPMSDGRSFNLFTGAIVDIKKTDYFTSLLNACIDDDDENIAKIEEWFNEITCGDKPQATYQKWISAYMLGFAMHDRKFFVCIGTGKNAKGLHKALLCKCSNGSHGTDPTWKGLNQSYWALTSNTSTGAESASPETFCMLDRTFFYTDDIGQVKIDCGKVKRIVAGEPIAARRLYGSPINISPRGKMFWTTNYDQLLEGEDNGIWERLALMKYSAKYVDRQEDVDHTKYRFLANRVRYDQILSLSNAFFTVCVRSLQKYYSSLELDPNTLYPVHLASFPTTPLMQQLKLEARARQLPLANFVQIYTRPTLEPLETVTVTQLFENYLIYLDSNNERKLRAQTTKLNFIEKLTHSLELNVIGEHVEGIRLSSFPPKPVSRVDYA